ncbi:MAG: ABC transporter ATP-binding protein [Burkholderiales bacterium]|nr:ABC transporter ATP-binding protein [Burkholderiales bacterium]
MSAALIEAVGLCKRFPVAAAGRRQALLHAVDRVDLAISRGESVGLVGESGCGKSTLVRLIARLIDPSEGALVYAEHDIGAVPAREFALRPERARIQMVFQDPTDSLNPRYTAADTIGESFERLARGGRGPGDTARAVAELADAVGLAPELLARFPHQLSGGQKARVGIARALAADPELLILDEPTSALDVSVQAVILKLLDRLRRERGLAYLFVSHDLNVVRLLCDRVVVMYLGRVIESGPAEEVFNAPRHPYTRALVSAIPRGPGRGAAERIRLSGEVASPIDPSPTVCRFASRCAQAFARCTSELPELRDVGVGRRVACHLE